MQNTRCTNSERASYGLYGGNVAVKGAINASSGNASRETIGFQYSSLELDNGAAVNVTSGNSESDESAGLLVRYGASALKLNNGMTLNASGGKGNPGCGVHIQNSTFGTGELVLNGGKLTSSDSDENGYGVYNDGNLFIYNGSATVSSGSALYKMDSSIVADEAVNVSVSANENGTGAAAWDKTTGLTEYKYIKTEGGAEIYGVFVGDLLNGENSITHTDDTANDNNGIKTEGALTIDGAGSVTAYGASGKQYARGMYVNGVLIVNGGAVTATGGESENYSAGIRGNLTVNDGQVIATGGYGKLRSCGAWGIEVTLSGGILTAAGGTSEQISAGVVSTALTVKDDAELTANGGTVQIKNAAGFIASIGIWGGDMTLENGNVTASGGTLKKDAEYDTFSNPTPSGTFGLYIPSGKTLSIKDGYLTATGGETLDELAPSVGNMAVYAASFTEAVGVVTRAGASMESAEEIMTPTSADLPQYYYLETEGAPYTILVVAGEEIQNKPKGTFYWKNNADNTGLTKEGASASDYSVSYDTQSKTLTLNVLDYEGDGFEDYGRFGVISYLEEPLKIALRGDNTISVSDAQEPVGGVVNSAETGGVYGMSFYSDVDFEGDGTLTVTAGRSYVGTSTGIEGYGNITFSDAVKINANASDTGTSSTTEQSIPLIGGSKRNSCAILCEEDGEVSIGEGAEVTATAGSSSGGSSFGVYAGSVTSAGKLTATAGSAFAGVFSSEFQDGSYGIYTGGDLNITDGTVSASGSTAAFAGMTAEGMIPGVTNGILCGGDVSLANGAALNATGGDGDSESACQSCGLRAMNILSGGTLTAKGGNVTIGTSYGIQLSDRPESDETASGHTMTVTGGVLDADGGNANQSAAVFGVNPTCITVIGGEIYAKTGEVYPFEYQGETMHGIASAIVSSDEAVTVNIPVTYEVKGSTSSGTEQDTVISSVGETSADMSEKNKKEFTGMRDDVIDRGYVPCKRCCL